MVHLHKHRDGRKWKYLYQHSRRSDYLEQNIHRTTSALLHNYTRHVESGLVDAYVKIIPVITCAYKYQLLPPFESRVAFNAAIPTEICPSRQEMFYLPLRYLLLNDFPDFDPFPKQTTSILPLRNSYSNAQTLLYFDQVKLL